jgi:hypothetical protein
VLRQGDIQKWEQHKETNESAKGLKMTLGKQWSIKRKRIKQKGVSRQGDIQKMGGRQGEDHQEEDQGRIGGRNHKYLVEEEQYKEYGNGNLSLSGVSG